MKLFLNPAIKLMNRLCFSCKINVMGVIMFIPVALLAFFFIRETKDSLDFAKSERTGVRVITPSYSLLKSVMDSRATSGQQITMSELEKTIAEASDLDLSGSLEPLKKGIAEALSLAGRDRLGDTVISLITEIADKSNLSLDPDMDSYYLMDTFVTKIPTLAEMTSRATAIASLSAAKGGVSIDDHTQLVVLSGQMLSLRNAIDGNMTKVFKASPGLRSDLEGPVKSLLDSNSLFTEELNKTISAGTASNSSDTAKAGNAAVSAIMTAATGIGTSLDNALQTRISNIHSRMYWRLSLCALSLILCVWLAIGFYYSLHGSLSEILSGIERVANGDLNTPVNVHTRDEMGKIANDFNQMTMGTEKMIVSLQNAVIELTEKSRKLLYSSEHMSKNAGEVAAQSQSIATASEEMAATSTDIAHNCGSAAEGARQAHGSAVSGSSVVQDTVAGMKRIAERVRITASTIESLGTRSDQIGEIIGTIEEIADQTNLLALNAAIEAARAGDMGRGFAVVADEVRALAERTTRATREIGEMIKSIQSETRGAVTSMDEALAEVGRGSEDAGKSGSALQEILDQIQQVNLQVSQIATAAEEQNATTGEIANYIQNVTSVMQGSAELATASANSANELTALAESLQAEMRRFKTEGSELFILELAKEDHKTFVENVEEVMNGNRRQEGSSLSTNHTCRFGKWYDGEGKALCGHLPSFRAISSPHERVHSVARLVVDAVNAGKIDQASQLFPQLKDLSREIISLLSEIRKEFDQQKITKAA
jgi:methyl-accepting chemotaxis protein